MSSVIRCIYARIYHNANVRILLNNKHDFFKLDFFIVAAAVEPMMELVLKRTPSYPLIAGNFIFFCGTRLEREEVIVELKCLE